MRINKFLPFAIIYFYLNTAGLPYGLTYAVLLAPLFYVWLLYKKREYTIYPFLLALTPFVVAHLTNGVNLPIYLTSLTLFISVYIFCYVFFSLVAPYINLNNIFQEVTIINFILSIVAIFALSTNLEPIFWTVNDISAGLTAFPRLSLGTYEPSYYSTLLVPIFVYFFLIFFFQPTNNYFLLFGLLIFSFILSFSIGVIATLIASIGIFFLVNLLKQRSKKRFWYWALILLCSCISLLAILVIFYPANPLFLRIDNVLAGNDSSGRGRTFEAFQLAYQVAELKSVWWGVGLGQIKIIGDPIIRSFYNYPKELVAIVTIPCAFAETLAIFGIFGAALRLLLEVYFFFKTNVLDNYYRTILFFYIFIYQFTGSYITNLAEYVIWLLAFSKCFSKFDRSRTLSTKTIAK